MICQKLSHFHSRVFTHEFTWECYRLLQAKKFSRNSSQFKWVPKETRYYLFIVEFLKRNLMSQVAELFRRPTTMLKTLYFSGNHHFYQKPPGTNFIRIGIENFFIYWPGRHNLGPGRHFQQNYQPGKLPGYISPGHLDRLF